MTLQSAFSTENKVEIVESRLPVAVLKRSRDLSAPLLLCSAIGEPSLQCLCPRLPMVQNNMSIKTAGEHEGCMFIPRTEYFLHTKSGANNINQNSRYASLRSPTPTCPNRFMRICFKDKKAFLCNPGVVSRVPRRAQMASTARQQLYTKT